MDLYVGVPSIIIDHDDRRRELYGKAGDCRIKMRGDYVVPEYRSVGGNLLDTDENILWVYDQTIRAIEEYNNNTPLLDGDCVQEIINSSNTAEASIVCEKLNISLPQKQLQHA